MKSEVIEGTLQNAFLRKSSSKVTLYESIDWLLSDGSTRRIEKIAVAPAVAEGLSPSMQGRFYTYQAIDHSGLTGVRTRNGRAAFAMPSGNEKIMLVAAIGGALWFTSVLLTRGSVALFGLAMAVLGGYFYFSYRKLRIEIRARFDADAAYAPTSTNPDQEELRAPI